MLDTPPEETFDDLTALAAQICTAPIALISLVDENRQWFKSKFGLTASETARDERFAENTCSKLFQAKAVGKWNSFRFTLPAARGWRCEK